MFCLVAILLVIVAVVFIIVICRRRCVQLEESGRTMLDASVEGWDDSHLNTPLTQELIHCKEIEVSDCTSYYQSRVELARVFVSAVLVA